MVDVMDGILSRMFPRLMSSYVKLFRKLIALSPMSKGLLCRSNLTVWMCFLAAYTMLSLSWIKSKYGRTLFSSTIIMSQMRCFAPIRVSWLGTYFVNSLFLSSNSLQHSSTFFFNPSLTLAMSIKSRFCFLKPVISIALRLSWDMAWESGE